MKSALLGIIAAIALIPNAKATPGAVTGAAISATVASIACDRLVRSYMEPTPESDAPWYFVWRHVGTEDIAGLGASVACAVPAGAVGFAAGLAIDGLIIGASATAAGAGAIVVVSKGVQIASRVVTAPAKRAAARVRTVTQRAEQWLGRVKFGSAAPSLNPLRTKHMEHLYAKQKGMDALCKVRLPPLYVGLPWARRLNPAIHIDHRIPKAKGGTDVPSNLQLTAAEFNLKKGVLTGHELRSAKRRFCPT